LEEDANAQQVKDFSMATAKLIAQHSILLSMVYACFNVVIINTKSMENA
jgi:hypothetical protein